MPISFSLSLNSGHGSTSEAVKLAVEAERQGLECVWYCQDLFQRDAWVFLTAAATHTSHIDLGTGIVNPYTANPAELAMHAATLDEYSGGRVRLGISVGAVEFLKWVGIRADHPVSAMKESFRILRGLLRGEAVEHNGTVFRGWTRDAYLRFKPLRDSVPLYLGAQKPRMLELIGEIADGGLPLLFPPEYCQDVLSHVARGARRAKRNPSDIDVVGCLWLSVADERESAKNALRELVSFYGPHLAPEMISKLGLRSEDFDEIRTALAGRDYQKAKALVTDEMAELAIYGTPEECIERIARLVDNGLRHIRFGPPLGPDVLAAVKLIGKHIVPYFRDRADCRSQLPKQLWHVPSCS